MNPGPWGILIIVVAVLLLFGRGKIAGMMGEVASGIKAFQRDMTDEEKQAKIDEKETVEAKPAKKSTKA
jgi:sec-independent protein translocase protein TatA